MNDDDPTRDLGDQGYQGSDDQDTVELGERWRRSPGRSQAWTGENGDPRRRPPADETQVIPDDLVPGPGHPSGSRHGAGLTDTQPINLEPAWRRRAPRQPPASARWRSRQQPPAGWSQQAGGWDRPDQPYGAAGWESAAPSRQQPAGASDWGPLPEAGRAPEGQAGGQAAGRGSRTRGQHLMVWAFTLLVALGLGATAVLGPWAEPLQLSGQASTLAVVVASLLAWALLSVLLRLAGIIAFVLTPLLLLAGSVPELQGLPVDIPRPSGAVTVIAMALGLSSWLAGHWYFYARKGWWRSRVAGAILSNIPGLENTRRPPEA
jgi:hypothetical protein